MRDDETYFEPLRESLRRNLRCPKCDAPGYSETLGQESCSKCGYLVDYHAGTYSK